MKMLHSKSVQRVLAMIGGVLLLILGIGLLMLYAPGDDSWDGVKRHVLPQFVPAKNKEIIPLVWKEFLPDVDIAYVIDRKQSYDFIIKPMLRTWGISEQELEQQAMRNLEKFARGTQIHMTKPERSPDIPYATIETGDGYAAVRILSQDIRGVLAKELGEPFTVAIPVRDFLIAWPKDFPVADDFIEQVQKEYDQEETYRLTPKILEGSPSSVTPLK